jgi:hypothetical protein
MACFLLGGQDIQDLRGPVFESSFACPLRQAQDMASTGSGCTFALVLLTYAVFRFFRSQSEKNETQKNVKYRSAACPELVEGKAKMPAV